MRAVVEHGWRPTAWQPACRIPSLELNHEWQKPRYIHVAAPAWRNHRHSGHLGGIRLMVQRMVHVERVGREHPSAIHQRSEEHTSELQSRGHLVCRLLLEKKKKESKEARSAFL